MTIMTMIQPNQLKQEHRLTLEQTKANVEKANALAIAARKAAAAGDLVRAEQLRNEFDSYWDKTEEDLVTALPG